VYNGIKYVTQKVVYNTKRKARTLHYSSGGIHTPKLKGVEVHYKTVPVSDYTYLSREEFLQAEIDALKKIDPYNRSERKIAKERIEKYQYYLDTKPWRAY
jgi:hypothetical protein